MSQKFWNHLDELVRTSPIVIDRPRNSAHPCYPDLIYPLDYGYLQGTSSADSDGIDVWIGSKWSGDTSISPLVKEIVVTVDLFKRDSEIKILLGWTPTEIDTILAFVSTDSQAGLLITRDG